MLTEGIAINGAPWTLPLAGDGYEHLIKVPPGGVLEDALSSVSRHAPQRRTVSLETSILRCLGH